MKVISLLFCSMVIVSAVPHRSILVPEQRSEGVAVNAAHNSALPYQYQIIPSSEYAVASYQQDDSSVFDYILSPVTAIMSVGSAALSVAHWLLVNFSLVLLGMSIIIGFCGFTSYCTMTIYNPFSRGLPAIPYLDDIQYYFSEAYNKYHDMQYAK